MKHKCDFCDEEAVEFFDDDFYCQKHWQEALEQAEVQADLNQHED